MRLVMVGLDHNTAEMKIRDSFSPEPSRQREILREMRGGDISGCALIATCNRTELYISHRGDVPPDGMEMLCRGLGMEARPYRRYFVERSERQAIEHLMQVAAGMCSSVPGDDQIITQVRSAIEKAREAGVADPFLEALFRAAVTAGKKVRTRARFTRDGASVASRAVEIAGLKLGGLAGRRALVIGNGVTACLVASGLLGAGCGVRITLRDLRREADMPAGCRIVDFADRYRALAECDMAISATSSPHYTLALSGWPENVRAPGLLIDLAVPRDIDPDIGETFGTTLLNVDDLRRDGDDDETLRRNLAKANDVIMEEAERFDAWRRNRRRLVRMEPGSPDFPIFINLRGASTLVVGGGKVAARRAEKLLGVGAGVLVVSPEISPGMAKLIEHGGARWLREPYQARHMEGMTLAIAATDRREVNASVGRDARERGILVSVADRRQECTFYFPAIVRSDLLAAGVISSNGDHRMVRRAAARLREEMEAIDADCQSGEPRERLGCGAGESDC